MNLFPAILFTIFLGASLVAVACAEDAPGKPAAQDFDGEIFGLAIQAQRLGIVLDVSESMTKHLPVLSAALRDKLPRAPMMKVDGCDLQRPDPLRRVSVGFAPETVTAVNVLAEGANIDAVLWIADMGDPPNRDGVVAMEKALAKHGIKLYILSVSLKPTPSVRKLAIDSDGDWKVKR